tara:strand:- start:6287 stop:7453 length:1167 start_codon:yes stop_codon:yes gene_type:complete
VDPIITSLLDTDLYKLTMMNAVSKLYPRTHARYQFINRERTTFPSGFASALREQINHLSTLQLTAEEREFLQAACPYFDPVYLDLLSGYRYDPNEVSVSQSDEELQVSIEGLWYRVILLEVKLLAIISELYFKMADNVEMIRDHIDSPIAIRKKAAEKTKQMQEAGATFADFGTRRRYSHSTQNNVIEGLISGSTFIGTSNVHFAMKYGLKPIGTMAHEFYSAVGSLKSLRHANKYAMEDWVSVYNGSLGIALADTFGSEAFFQDFDSKFAQLFSGIRQDSGDPIKFGERAIQHYGELGIDPTSKSIIFSDGLDIIEAIRIHNHFKGRIKTSFGIGTSLTNSIGAKPLNIVIKLVEIDGIPAIKLSDVSGKETGDAKTIKYAKWILNL